MRFVLGLLAGLLGMLAGWFGLALAIISFTGPGNAGGAAMGAFFGIGPIGGLAGLVAGIVLFRKYGIVRAAAPTEAASEPGGDPSAAAAAEPGQVRPAVAAVLLLVTAVLIGWAWRELLM